jgi:hypothetical protein
MPTTPFENDTHVFQWVKRLKGVRYLVIKKPCYKDQICAVMKKKNDKTRVVEWQFYNRIYYMWACWLQPDKKDNSPYSFAPRCYYEYETFDGGWDTDDEEGTLTAIGQDDEPIWTEDMKSGMILDSGEMVTPGARIVKVEVCKSNWQDSPH